VDACAIRPVVLARSGWTMCSACCKVSVGAVRCVGIWVAWRSLGPHTDFFLRRQRHVASAWAHAVHAQGSSPSEPVPDHLIWAPPPTNIQAGAAQGRLNLATLRSLATTRQSFSSAHCQLWPRRQPDSLWLRHTAARPLAPGTSRPPARHSQTAAVRNPEACKPGIAQGYWVRHTYHQ